MKKQSPAHRSQNRLLGETGAYLFGSVLYFWKSKWGISDKTATRRAQVDKDVAGVVFCVFSREILFGWHCEQLVHRIYGALNAPMKTGTGRSEWFVNVNLLLGTALFCGTVWEGIVLNWYWYALGFWTPFVWIEGLLWLLLFRFLNWCFAVALFWAIDRVWQFGLFDFFVSLFRY